VKDKGKMGGPMHPHVMKNVGRECDVVVGGWREAQSRDEGSGLHIGLALLMLCSHAIHRCCCCCCCYSAQSFTKVFQY
jgi:hypothetical protein